MWKIIIGFVIFAGLALFVLMKSGGDVDMSGEKHGAETQAEPAKTDTTKTDTSKTDKATP